MSVLRRRRPGPSTRAVVWVTAFAMLSVGWVLVLGFAFAMTVVHDPELSGMRSTVDAAGGFGWYLWALSAVIILPPAFVASIVVLEN